MKQLCLAVLAAFFMISCGENSQKNQKQQSNQATNELIEEQTDTDSLRMVSNDQDSASTLILFSYKQAVSNGPGQIFRSDSGDISLFVYPGGYGCIQNTPNVVYNDATGFGDLNYKQCLVTNLDTTFYNSWMFSLVVNKDVETDRLLTCQRTDGTVIVDVSNVSVANRDEVDTMTFIVLSPQNIFTTGLEINYANSYTGKKEKSVKAFAPSTGSGWEEPPVND